jgi:hypothetical protein
VDGSLGRRRHSTESLEEEGRLDLGCEEAVASMKVVAEHCRVWLALAEEVARLRELLIDWKVV